MMRFGLLLFHANVSVMSDTGCYISNLFIFKSANSIEKNNKIYDNENVDNYYIIGGKLGACPMRHCNGRGNTKSRKSKTHNILILYNLIYLLYISV